MLTNRQRELFQEDKHILVETIIVLEDKLLKAIEALESERNSRIILESERDIANGAHIKAQEEIDKLESKWTKGKREDTMSEGEKIKRAIGTWKDFKEEGENGQN